MRRLAAHFAEDHIGVEELERRLDRAYAATSLQELEALTSDLPALREEPETEPAVRVRSDLGVSDSELAIAIMGGAERKGDWTPPRRLTVVAVMGGAEIDFREAEFGAPETDLFVLAIMGGVDVVVPPGVRVESNGLAIMGGFGGAAMRGRSGAGPRGETAHPKAPLVRIRGFALMGGVDVSVRLPGESQRDARKRLRAERKARKRLSEPS